MKILFSADWHIKLGQKNVPREWQKNRYEMLFQKIYELEAQCDAHILGGDIFDTVPKPEEVGMYLDFVSGCSIHTIIYDGNHEATKKGHTFFQYLSKATKNMNKNVDVLDGPTTINLGVDIDFIPYTHLKTFNPKDFNSDILCTHVRGEIPPHVVPEIDLEKLDRWKTVLAGDLHSHENTQRNIIYPGSPLSISFHRNKIKNGVIIFDTDNMEYEFIDLGLPQLIRKTVETEDEIVKTEYDHTIYEITGNILELSGIDTTSDIIDKKIIKTATEAKLHLSDMSIEEELKLYFESIMNLSDEDTIETLRIFSDYYKELEVE